jgi:outer membrane assembly lipoprotein YfiO
MRRARRRFLFGPSIAAALLGCGGPHVSLPPTDPRYQFELGRAQFERHHWLEAQTPLKAFLDAHPGHALADSAQYLLGRSMYVGKSYAEAAVEFAILGREYPRSELRDDASYYECLSYSQQMRSAQLDPTFALRARTCLQEFLLRYPETDLGGEARKRIAEIDDRLAEKEYRLGVLFAKMKRPAAARVYLEGLVQTYPQSRWVPDAVLWIGRSHETEGHYTDAFAAYQRLGAEFPNTPAAQEAGQRAKKLLERDPGLGAAAADSLTRP